MSNSRGVFRLSFFLGIFGAVIGYFGSIEHYSSRTDNITWQKEFQDGSPNSEVDRSWLIKYGMNPDRFSITENGTFVPKVGVRPPQPAYQRIIGALIGFLVIFFIIQGIGWIINGFKSDA